MPKKKLKINKSDIIREISNNWVTLGLINCSETLDIALELKPIGINSLKTILITSYRLLEFKRNGKFQATEIDHLFKAAMGIVT